MDKRIFISYRRHDQGRRTFATANWLEGALKPQFAYVFLDPQLTPGEVWCDQLNVELEKCNILLAVIDERTTVRGRVL